VQIEGICDQSYKYTTVQAVQGVTTNQNALVNNSMREKSVALLLYARETLYDHLYTLLNFNSYHNLRMLCF